MSNITIFTARKIITMDPNRAVATHVAVKDGRILAVGGADCADFWGGGQLDTSLADSVLMPGFVEGHAHLMAGAIWAFTYTGFYDARDPNGKVWPGLKNVEDVITALREAEAKLPAGEPLCAWGFDPIFLPTERLNCKHLDQVSTERTIIVLHSNGHLLTTNSAGLASANYDRNTNVEGVARFADGTPNGELQEMAAMFPVSRRAKFDLRAIARTERALMDYGRLAQYVGVTTSADLVAELPDDDLEHVLRVTKSAEFPIRLVPALSGLMAPPEEIVARMPGLKKLSHDKLKIGMVKLMTDGSIQGYTSRMKWPGHVNGAPNGIWNNPPEVMHHMIEVIHAAGIQIHVHTNGDEASEVAINGFQAAMRKYPNADHRHTLQHGQMINEAQFRRIKALGLGVNLFANHIWYFGDKHYEVTQGPDRALRMDACRSALDHGVPMTIHSDAPVTPLNPLFTAWCAVNRVTPQGRILGKYQRLTVHEALSAITIGAAYSMHMDGDVGSIETGKFADFVILGDDPLAVDPMALKDVPVLGTVLGGQVQLL